MKEYKWVPQTKTEDGKDIFKGYITLKIPPSKKRVEYISQIQFEVDRDGKVQTTTKQFDQFAKMEEIAKEYVSGFQLVHIESGIDITSWEDLDPLAEYMVLVGQIANTILSGIKLGEIYAERSKSK